MNQMKCVVAAAGLSAIWLGACASESKNDVSLGMMAQAEKAAARQALAPAQAHYAKLPGFSKVDTTANPPTPLHADAGKEAIVAIKGGGRAYKVIFGGGVDATTNAPATGHFEVPDPTFTLDTDGFVVAAGWRPYISTPLVDAGSEGTVMIVYAENTGQIDVLNRVFLIHGGPVRIMPQSAGPLCNPGVVLQTVGTYVECTLNATNQCVNFSSATAIPADTNDPVRQFVDYVLELENVEELIAP